MSLQFEEEVVGKAVGRVPAVQDIGLLIFPIR